MIHITKQATDHLLELRADKGLGRRVGIRFVRSGGRLGLIFADRPAAGDVVVPTEDVAVYVASEIADVFDQATIDARIEDERTRLVLRKSRQADA